MWQTLTTIDGNILLFLQNYIRNDVLTPIMTTVSTIGNKGAIWLLISIILLFPKRTRLIGFLSLVSIAITYGINNLWLKNFIARTRPYEVIDGLHCLMKHADDYSFPSGHAASSFAVGVMLFRCANKKPVKALVMILAFLIAFSRVYVGIHYPSDVIAGAVIGTVIATIIFLLFGRKAKERLERAKKKLRYKRRKKSCW